MLTNAELGVSITGVILLAEEPKQFSGTSAKGKPYNFAQRRLQLWTGNKTTLCTQRKDKIEEFGAVPVGVKVTLRVLSGRIDQGQMVFDVEN